MSINKDRSIKAHDLSKLLLNEKELKSLQENYKFHESFDLDFHLQNLINKIHTLAEIKRLNPRGDLKKDISRLHFLLKKQKKYIQEILKIFEENPLTKSYLYYDPSNIELFYLFEENLKPNLKILEPLILSCETGQKDLPKGKRGKDTVFIKNLFILRTITEIYHKGTGLKPTCNRNPTDEKEFTGRFYDFVIEFNYYLIQKNEQLSLGANDTIGDALRSFLENERATGNFL